MIPPIPVFPINSVRRRHPLSASEKHQMDFCFSNVLAHKYVLMRPCRHYAFAREEVRKTLLNMTVYDPPHKVILYIRVDVSGDCGLRLQKDMKIRCACVLLVGMF